MTEQSVPRSTAMSADAAEFIREPTPCAKCGYDLRGLFVGSKCPECGTVIGQRKKYIDDHMGDAPPVYLNTLASALVVFGVSGMLVPLGAFMGLVGVRAGEYFAIASIAVLPIAGFVILRKRIRPRVKRRPGDTGEEWSGLRKGSAAGYIAQYLFLVFFIVHRATPLNVPDWIFFLLGTAMGVGICLAAWHISLLADWARDYGRAQQFRACSMGFALYLVINAVAFVVNAPLGGLFSLTPATAGFGVLIGLISTMVSVVAFGCLMLIFLFSMLFASTVRWSIHNARTERERDTRMAERARERAEELAARSDAASLKAAPLFEAPDPDEAGVVLLDSGSDIEEPEEEDEDKYNPYGLEND